ncbi:MAG TPA: ATP-binding protein [Rhodanobacteraceae bacterium]|nr:ATP-binding protein [Rhodanobacteraceae bacterium]
MLRTNADATWLAELTTGVARLDGDLRIAAVNPAFVEHTGFGSSRLGGATLAVLTPDGVRLHAAAVRARDERTSTRVRGATVCAEPGRDARLTFTFTPLANGVLVEVQPAPEVPGATRISQSLRGFAHEIRNPLAAIAGAAELLEQRAADGRQRELARLIRQEAARLTALSARLLGTRTATADRAVNLHAVLERAAGLLAAEGAGVAITRDYDPSLPAWQGDPDRLLQAILNLVRNAVEAHARHVVLRSRAEAGWRDRRGHTVPALRVEVEDDGDGVPDALAASLFEPMVSGRAGGSGLGLALAREIAREHGGDLGLQRLPRGSRFVLRLPRRAGTPHVSSPALAEASA